MQVIQKIKFLLHRSLIPGSSDPGSGNRLRCSRNTYIKNQRNIRIIGSVSLILLLALTAFTLRPVSVSTDLAEATANPATTTLTVETSGNAAVLDITPSSTTGTFSSSDTSGTNLAFNVSTNNITGYNLGISHASATSPAPLVNEALSLNLDSLGTSVTESQFSTSAYVGRYGYKPSMLNSADNSNYIPAPTTTATTLNVTSQANTTDTSDNYTIALGANIDYTKSAGTYTNTFILTAVANNVPYRINYLDDTSDSTVTGLPTAEASSTATASGFTLSDTTPTRTGYTFAGWCDGTVTHNATGNDTCNGTTYSAGSAYSFASPSSTSTNVANLYAMWNVKSFAITLAKTNATAIKIDGTSYTGSSATLTYGNHTISGTYASGYEFSSWSTSNSTNLAITSTTSASTTITVHGAATLTLTGKSSMRAIQDITSSTCTTTAQDVYDKRDNQVYKIQKLADGKCWLLDNLRLGSADFASGVTELNSTNTNTTNSIATSTFTDWNTTSGSWSYDTPMINTTWANTPTTGYGSGSSKIGVYYNYCAATMQSYCMAEGSGDGNATQDVCPAGWRMPTGGYNGEYQALCNAVKGSACSSSSEDTSADALKLREALSTPLSGSFNFNYSIAYDQGRGGDFWSSTRYDSKSVHILIVTSSYVHPHYDYRYDGIPVRCVLKEPIESVTYMQDITSEMVANTTVGATATLIDKRDNQSYLVGKLADGKLWMLDNLRLGSADFASGVTELNSTNTNTTNSIATSTFTGWNATSGFTSDTGPMINTASVNDTTTGYGSGSGKIGVYYNYCAATMQSYCYASGSGTGNASQDVCPKGWRMPTGGSSGEYQNLYSKYSSNVTNFSNALSTTLSGYFWNGSDYEQGSFGYFWSSTYYNGYAMHYLYVGSSAVYQQHDYTRALGLSVRCVLK